MTPYRHDPKDIKRWVRDASAATVADHGAFKIWTRDHGRTLGLSIETADPEDFAKFREACDLAERILRLRNQDHNELDAEWAE